MSNMSYCRFQNTASDLSDCQEALENLLQHNPDEDGDSALSKDEAMAAKRLLKTALAMVQIVAETQARKIEDLDDSDMEECIDQAQELALEADAERAEKK